jgi:hypothetical protein
MTEGKIMTHTENTDRRPTSIQIEVTPDDLEILEGALIIFAQLESEDGRDDVAAQSRALCDKLAVRRGLKIGEPTNGL